MRERQAWQWWQRQQILQSHHSAESIRDGILQQTFAFRRYLESAPATHPPTEQTARWLDRFQLFYQSLEHLSNQLSPPFAADSLPLALQFVLKNWQKDYPHLVLQFDLPSDWPYSTRHSQTILSVLTGLLTLLIPADDRLEENAPGYRSPHLQFTLSSQDSQNGQKTRHTLTFQLAESTAETTKALADRPEIQHLKEIFHGLAAGRLDINNAGTSLTGHLRWYDD